MKGKKIFTKGFILQKYKRNIDDKIENNVAIMMSTFTRLVQHWQIMMIMVLTKKTTTKKKQKLRTKTRKNHEKSMKIIPGKPKMVQV